MNTLIQTGKSRTILLSISILLISIHTIYFYHASQPEIETKKIVQQVIRFSLTVGLLIMLYMGKNWAKQVSIFLFSLSVIGGLIAMFSIETKSFFVKSPLLVMVVVFSLALYHFGVSKAYRAFAEFQNEKTK